MQHELIILRVAVFPDISFIKMYTFPVQYGTYDMWKTYIVLLCVVPDMYFSNHKIKGTVKYIQDTVREFSVFWKAIDTTFLHLFIQ